LFASVKNYSRIIGPNQPKGLVDRPKVNWQFHLFFPANSFPMIFFQWVFDPGACFPLNYGKHQGGSLFRSFRKGAFPKRQISFPSIACIAPGPGGPLAPIKTFKKKFKVQVWILFPMKKMGSSKSYAEKSLAHSRELCPPIRNIGGTLQSLWIQKKTDGLGIFKGKIWPAFKEIPCTVSVRPSFV